MTNIFFVALAALSLLGCGKFDRLENGGFTTVSFRGNGNPAISTLPGGILIYIYSASYATNLKIANGFTGAEASISLPNGQYSFYAFGYDGDANTFTTNIKCAVAGGSSPIPLDGSAITIPLTFDVATCLTGSFFSPSGLVESSSGTTNFSRMNVTFCGNGIGTNLANTLISGSDNCSSGGSSPINGTQGPWAAASGYQMIAPLFRAAGTSSFVKMGEAYRSSCITGSVDSGFNNFANFRFPTGVSGQEGRFPLEFETFSETACTSPPLASHKFHKGAIFGPSPTSSEQGAFFTFNQFPKIFLRQP